MWTNLKQHCSGAVGTFKRWGLQGITQSFREVALKGVVNDGTLALFSSAVFYTYFYNALVL